MRVGKKKSDNEKWKSLLESQAGVQIEGKSPLGIAEPKGKYKVKGRKMKKVADQDKRHKYNAKKVKLSDGQVFDSKNEFYMYEVLTKLGIIFQRQVTIVLMQGFIYQGVSIRPITAKVDYMILDPSGTTSIAVVDPKGLITPDAILKFKLLKRKFFDLNHQVPVFLPTGKAKCDQVGIQLLGLYSQIKENGSVFMNKQTELL